MRELNGKRVIVTGATAESDAGFASGLPRREVMLPYLT